MSQAAEQVIIDLDAVSRAVIEQVERARDCSMGNAHHTCDATTMPYRTYIFGLKDFGVSQNDLVKYFCEVLLLCSAGYDRIYWRTLPEVKKSGNVFTVYCRFSGA